MSFLKKVIGGMTFVFFLILVSALNDRSIPTGRTESVETNDQAETVAQSVKPKMHPKKKTSMRIEWDGTYENTNCGTAKECLDVGGRLNVAGKEKEAMPYFAMACDKGLPDSCYLLGSYSKRDSNQATKWYEKACALRFNKEDCFPIIWANLHNNKMSEAKALFKRLCPTDEDGMCEGGILSVPTKNTVQKMLRSLCDEGHPVSCNILAKQAAN